MEEGLTLEKQGKYMEAIQIYENLLRMNPSNGCALNQIGVCYFQLRHFEKAIDTFKNILRIKNDIPDVYNNIATCYVTLRNYKSAETALNISLKLHETDSVHFAIGNLYFYMKEYTKSIHHYQLISSIKTHASYRYNLCFPFLALQQFKIGWELYENRLQDLTIVPQTKEPPRVEIPWIPNWDGRSPFQHLLVIYEQGIGDNIQFFRFLLEFSRKYPERKFTYFCKNTVAHLFPTHLPNVQIVLQLAIPIFDYKVYMMSLPYYLQMETISPLQENYITSPLDLYPLPCKPMKIGFVHNGLLSSFIEKYIAIQEWDIFGDLSNVAFISLGNDIPASDRIGRPSNFYFMDIDKKLPFQDSVSILSQLDLFITVDTALAHIAGVMQVKTWLLLGYGSDWRWFSDTQSLWYTNMELFRMKENKDMKALLPVVKKRIQEICSI